MYGTSRNRSAHSRTSALSVGGVGGTAATSLSIAHAGSNRPGTATGNQSSCGAPSAIRRVPKVTPGTARAASGSSRRAVAVATTTCHQPVRSSTSPRSRWRAATRTPAAWIPSRVESWSIGSQPGYPLGWRELGWLSATTLAQSPLTSSTRTFSPSSSWLSVRPGRSSRCSGVISSTQSRGRDGTQSAGSSTGRTRSGEVHSVATATQTTASPPGDTIGSLAASRVPRLTGPPSFLVQPVHPGGPGRPGDRSVRVVVILAQPATIRTLTIGQRPARPGGIDVMRWRATPSFRWSASRRRRAPRRT